jgi:hypothetical protein
MLNTTTPPARQDQSLRHRCRNPRCRLKLPAPTENEHKAFCCRGCFKSFYKARCLVCEKDISASPITGERRKRLTQHYYCGRKCRNEFARFPHIFRWEGISPQKPPPSERSARKTGLKNGHERHRLRWGDSDPEAGDYSLYDRGGLTLARIVGGGGRFHLRSPITWPRMSWPDLAEAKQGAEAIALAALPPEAKTTARLKRDNETPHPLGAPAGRSFDIGAGVLHGAGSKIAEAKVLSDPGDIPNFLRRHHP